jgi:hypothetical protein
MITPHKYLNLDLSVINVSALIIDKLKKHSLLTYDELLNMTINALGKNAKEVFPYSLNFLFLLDKLHYSSQLDVFQLNFD